MTDMEKQDWADELAWTLLSEYKHESIAAAIRKAKANGLKEAADLIKAHKDAAPKFYWEKDEIVLLSKIDKLLRDYASKLESPTE